MDNKQNTCLHCGHTKQMYRKFYRDTRDRNSQWIPCLKPFVNCSNVKCFSHFNYSTQVTIVDCYEAIRYMPVHETSTDNKDSFAETAQLINSLQSFAF